MADMQAFRRCALPLSKRIDGPDVHQFVSGHTVVDRVKRHGLVAVRRQQLAVDTLWAFRAALSWGGWATRREEWAEAAEAYRFGVAAAHRLFEAQLQREDTETMLRLAAACMPVPATHSRSSRSPGRQLSPWNAAGRCC